MSSATPSSHSPTLADRLARAEKWLDDRGKGAWIVLIVLGFIFFWPVGLALLAWVIWGRSLYEGRDLPGAAAGAAPARNTAFDTYRTETLQRLTSDQGRFDDFIDRLRSARDRQEFDDFLDDRAQAAKLARDSAADPETD